MAESGVPRGRWWLLLLLAVAAYLLGSISFSVIFSKTMFRTDVRTQGSGNAGFTNVLRSFGKKAAVPTLLCDLLKGAVAVVPGYLLGGMTGAYLCGLFCVAGHCYPVFFGFKGGKGVLTTAGLLLALDWPLLGILVLVGVPLVLVTRIVSVGSLTVAFLCPIAAWILGRRGIAMLFYLFVAAHLLFSHRQNIIRLLKGTENRFGSSKK